MFVEVFIDKKMVYTDPYIIGARRYYTYSSVQSQVIGTTATCYASRHKSRCKRCEAAQVGVLAAPCGARRPYTAVFWFTAVTAVDYGFGWCF